MHRNKPFEARLFDPERGNEALEGTLSIDQSALRFESESGSHEIPIDQAALGPDSGSGRLCFYDVERPEVRIFTLDDSILHDLSFQRCLPLRSQWNAIASRRELVSRLRIVLYFVAVCFLLGWMISWASGAMVRVIANRVPPEWERKFGDDQMKRIGDQMVLLDASNEVAQLEALCEPLLRVAPLGKTKVQFHIAESPTPNAFALPGGHVIINTGLLRMTEQPEELLGVIAHELAHLTQKHHIRQIISAAGPLVIFGIFLHSGDDLMNVLTAGAGIMVYEGFSQDYEQEADDFGWKYMLAARLDPRGMISCFQKLQTFELRMHRVKLPQAFSSHPALEKRIARLQNRWSNLAPKPQFAQVTTPVPKMQSSDLPERIPTRRR